MRSVNQMEKIPSYDTELVDIISGAFDRLWKQSRAAGFLLGQRIEEWILDYFKTDHPEQAYTSPGSFPILLLPWLAEKKFNPRHNLEFQTDLVYSTINGYLYIRLIDNLLDGHRPQDIKLLPAINFFHTQFQSPYQKYFDYDHSFWDHFRSIWFSCAEATLGDAELKEIELNAFVDICAQKTSAAKIPVLAVCLHNESPDEFPMWERFIDLYGCWHQMWNDFFDWEKDTRLSTVTYFLSEAQRRKKIDEPLVDWVIREGFNWGISLLEGWMSDLQALATQMENEKLEKYLVERKKAFGIQKDQEVEKMIRTARLLSGLRQILEIDD